MTFDPNSKLMDMRGKQYLEVKWRIVWFREDHPLGSIVTEVVNYDPQVVHASVMTEDGKVLGTGIGTPKMQGVAKARPFEGAETAAIGRALAHAGYGTQFTDEEEGEHLADAPVEASKLVGTPKPERPYNALACKAKILEVAGKYRLKKATTSDAQNRAFVITYDSLWGGVKESRYAVTKWIFGKASTKDLEDAEKLALIRWMDWEEVPEGGYIPSQVAMSEAQIMLRHVEKEQGQQELL